MQEGDGKNQEPDPSLSIDYRHYRCASVGLALKGEGHELGGVLGELVEEGKLTAEQAVQVTQEFDVQMNRHLKQQQPMLVKMEGQVMAYNNAENVWNWRLQNVSLRFAPTDKELKTEVPIEVDQLHVVAMDAFPGRVVQRGKKRRKVSAKTGRKVT